MPQQTISSQTIPPPTQMPASGGSRAIPPALYKIDKGQFAQRVELIREHNQTLAPEEIHLMLNRADIEKSGRPPLTGEQARATSSGCLGMVLPSKGYLRGRPRGRLGTEGSGRGRVRGRPRGRFSPVGSTVERW